MKLLLVGNPNAGKSTLFNRLTGGHARVGNWHGVTVGALEGEARLAGKTVTVVDLPGMYTPQGRSMEEKAARACLDGAPDACVLFVAECASLARVLPLLFALCAGRRTALVLTKRRAFCRRGGRLDMARLAARLGCPVLDGEGKRRALLEGIGAALSCSVLKARTVSLDGVWSAERGEGGDVLLNAFVALPCFLALLVLSFALTFVPWGPGALMMKCPDVMKNTIFLPGGIMYSTTDFRRGLKIEIDGTPYEIVEFQHFKPGKGGAMVRTKLRNILNGRVVDNTFRSGEKVGKPDMEQRDMQYLYREGTDLIFMDMTTYEQISLPEADTDGKADWLLESQQCRVLLYNGQPIDIEVPVSLVMTVTKTEPGVKGDTVSNVTKPATLETGVTIQVPIFVNEGDRVKVDTRTREYLGRD